MRTPLAWPEEWARNCSTVTVPRHLAQIRPGFYLAEDSHTHI